MLWSPCMDPQALRACALFQTLPADRLRRVAEIATHRDLPAGAIIFSEGEAGDEMYVVVAGKVRISKRVFGSFPHQPARRGSDGSSPCFWWTKQPPTAPGPAFRYL